MTWLRFVIVAGIFTVFTVLPVSADAGTCSGGSSSHTTGSSGLTGILISGEHATDPGSCEGTSSVSTVKLPPRDSDLDALCVQEAISTDRDPFDFCDLPTDGEAIQLTPGMVAAAFRRLALPASVLVVQPPGGRTLVNFDTNFYTENGEFTRSVSLLGQRVVLRIWPKAYGWRFGDGGSEQSVGAGSPYPDLVITHRYLSKGRVSPRVDTTYAAQFRVDGGPWRDVAGTVTIPGGVQGLRVVEARPVLVGY